MEKEALPEATMADNPSAKQEQVHDLLFSRELGWQEILYDLINTEQLDPWDLDITILTNKYLEKIHALEEADFFVSSKVLLAAALLLRIKSEILLNRYVKSVDEILFGKQEKKYKPLERISLDGEIPELIPRSPIPRFKKVTLKELIESLNKAIITENRRIKKQIIKTNALRESSISLPRKKFNIKDKIKEIHLKIRGYFDITKNKKRVGYTDIIGSDREEKIISFYPILQLENSDKVWLEQEEHFDEIYIWLKKTFLKHNPDPWKELRDQLEKEISEEDSKKRKRIKEINKDFENPIDDLLEG